MAGQDLQLSAANYPADGHKIGEDALMIDPHLYP